MKLIIIGNGFQPTREVELKNSSLWVMLATVFLLLVGFSVAIWLAHDRGNKLNTIHQKLSKIEAEFLYDKNQLNKYYAYSDAFFSEQSKQAGFLEARITRIEAFGQKMADTAGFVEEFDFTSALALGGLDEVARESGEFSPVNRESLNGMFRRLDRTLSYREKEIEALSSLLQDTGLSKERYLTGKPIEKGWLSSHFGSRRDPFHGRPAFHKGVDFAGKPESNILSVASGVVVWSGDRYGYGTMVEIDHANGFVTRYAHNSKNTVKVGDVVSKGQVIAKMGSSGRSTGPHVHFEVLENGRHVDPGRYIYRKAV